jgi:hypothetical protein
MPVPPLDQSSRIARIAMATMAGLLSAGLPYWGIPYREVSLPGNPSPLLWFGLGGGAGFLAGYLLPGTRAPWLSVAGGFVLAILLRVIVETNRDPTSHNLWPFEVVIAGFFGLTAGLAGLLLARATQRLFRKV